MICKILFAFIAMIGPWRTPITKRHHSSRPHVLWITSIIYSSMIVVYLQMGGALIPLVFALAESSGRLTTLACKCAAR